VLDALMSAAPCADRVFVQATCILAFCDHAQIANKGQANQPSLFQQPARVLPLMTPEVYEMAVGTLGASVLIVYRYFRDVVSSGNVHECWTRPR
jgi:hypothetical protein